MSLLQQKKESLYTVMNELLDIYGESVKNASQNQDFRAKVAPHIADLFAADTGSNEILEICHILLSGYEKGVYKLEDLYEFRDLMVQLRGKILKSAGDEGDISLHEAVGRIMMTGLYGQHVGDAAAELRDKNIVVGSAIVAYLHREE